MKTKKIIALMIACIMSVGFVACKNDNNPTEDNNSSNNTIIIDYDSALTALVENGSSPYSIVIPEDATECNIYAAEEVSSFIYQSTGASVSVITDSQARYDKNNNYISIGKTDLLEQANFDIDYSTFNQDGFFMKSVGNMIFIDGYLQKGMLYGSYSFLERFLGVRFLTAECTYVPKLNKVPLYAMDIVDIPDFSARVYLTPDVYLDQAGQTFLARSRQDSMMWEGVMKRYGMSWDEKYGEKTSFFNRSGGDHNFHYFVDESIYNDPEKPETYHPEFYDEHETFHTTICLTNGVTDEGTLDESMDVSVAKIVIEEMKKDILANPQALYFGFTQEDGWNYCECVRCNEVAAKYGRSGVQMRFCNMMIDQLKAWAEEINLGRPFSIVTFAYSYTAEAPTKFENGEYVPIDETVRARPELVIRKADSYDACYHYFHEKQAASRVISNASWASCAENFMFWLHDKDFYDYLSYYPNLHTLNDNVRGMYDFGATNVLINGPQNGEGDWQGYMRSYIYRNLLWDMDLDAWDLAMEFIELYFGESAAPYVKQLVQSYEMNYKIAHEKYPDYTICTLQHEYVDPNKGMINLTFLESMLDLVEQATVAIETNESYSYEQRQAYLKRIAQVKCTPLGTIWRNYFSFYPLAEDTDWRKFLSEFFDTLSTGGVKCLREVLAVETYKESIGWK